MIILGPKTAILGPQFCRSLVLGPHFWWSGGPGPPGPPGSAPDFPFFISGLCGRNAFDVSLRAVGGELASLSTAQILGMCGIL